MPSSKKSAKAAQDMSQSKVNLGTPYITILRLAENGLQKTKPFLAIGDKHVTTCKDKTQLVFTSVINPSLSSNPQVDLFEKVIPSIASIFNGKSSIIFSLGATKSGKSFCVQGTREYPGLLPRTVEHLFTNINK